MKSFSVRYALLLAGLIFLAGIAPGIAHKGASGIVKTRMDAMRDLKNDLKLIKDMLTGKKRFRSERLTRVLNNVGGHAGEAMVKLFPKGSNQHPSEADPVIWTKWQEFKELAEALKVKTDLFRQRAKEKTPPVHLNENYSELRAVCRQCHDRFRL